MADKNDRLGSSGVFKAIVDGARKVKRAVTGGDPELPPEVLEIGNEIARAFISGRFADVHAMGTQGLQHKTTREQFVASWSYAVRGPLTGFEVANSGQIDLGFIPGLEDVPQEQFVAFLEIAFSSPGVPLEDPKAFVIAVVLLDEGGHVRLGAIHTR